MKQKQHYEAPWAQAFVVQPEGMICVSNPETLEMLGLFGDTGEAGSLILDEGFTLL